MMDISGEYLRKVQVCRRQTATGRRALHFHQHEIQALFEELIHEPWGRAQWNPPADVREDEKTFVIEVDLPGVSEKDVQIQAEGRTLTIAGRRQLRPCDDDRTTHLCERPDGGFARLFEFRENLEDERVRSRWENGVLKVTVLKPREQWDEDHESQARG